MGALTHQTIENRTAFATASLNTDFNPPQNARAAIFFWRISSVAGTTPIADCKLQYRDGASGQFIDVDGATFAQQTAASAQYLVMESGVVADTTGNGRAVGLPPSAVMRAAFTFDRTTTDETYSFTLSVDWLR